MQYIGDVRLIAVGSDGHSYPVQCQLPTQAAGTLTSNNTNVSDGDIVTVGGKTYTFKTALTPTEGQVLIGTDADASLLNLIRAINHSGTPGTDYKVNMPNPKVTAATSVTSHAFAVTARTDLDSVQGPLGNSIPSTKTSATLSWAATTLTGGKYGALITATS